MYPVCSQWQGFTEIDRQDWKDNSNQCEVWEQLEINREGQLHNQWIAYAVDNVRGKQSPGIKNNCNSSPTATISALIESYTMCRDTITQHPVASSRNAAVAAAAAQLPFSTASTAFATASLL